MRLELIIHSQLTQAKKTSASVTVNRKPTISVAATSPSVNEGEAVQYHLYLRCCSVPEDFAVNITLSETGSNFLAADPTSVTSVSLGAGTQHIQDFATKTNDNQFGANSVVTLLMAIGDDYKVGTASPVSVAVLDQSTPTDGISIIAVSDSVTENGIADAEAIFQIRSPSTEVATSARIINISVDDGDADFLSDASRNMSTFTIPQDATGC